MARLSRAWPRTQGIPSAAPRSASQIPGAHALDADHDILAEGLQRVEKCLGISAVVLVHTHLAVGIEDAAVRPVHVSVEAAGTRVLSRVQSHGSPPG
jgi:hypothetical protein